MSLIHLVQFSAFFIAILYVMYCRLCHYLFLLYLVMHAVLAKHVVLLQCSHHQTRCLLNQWYPVFSWSQVLCYTNHTVYLILMLVTYVIKVDCLIWALKGQDHLVSHIRLVVWQFFSITFILLHALCCFSLKNVIYYKISFSINTIFRVCLTFRVNFMIAV